MGECQNIQMYGNMKIFMPLSLSSFLSNLIVHYKIKLFVFNKLKSNAECYFGLGDRACMNDGLQSLYCTQHFRPHLYTIFLLFIIYCHLTKFLCAKYQSIKFVMEFISNTARPTCHQSFDKACFCLYACYFGILFIKIIHKLDENEIAEI